MFKKKKIKIEYGELYNKVDGDWIFYTPNKGEEVISNGGLLVEALNCLGCLGWKMSTNLSLDNTTSYILYREWSE